MSSSTGGTGSRCGDNLAGDKCDVKLIAAGNEFITSSPPSFNVATIQLPPLWSSLLYFQLSHSTALPLWLSAHVSCYGEDRSDAAVTLLQWTTTTASNQTAEQLQEAVIGMSRYNATNTTADYRTANPRPLSTQRNGGADSILVSPLTDSGYYGLLLTNTHHNATHNLTVSLSSFSSRPVVSLASALSISFPINSIGLFFLFLLLSSLCLACLVLGRRYLAGFRRKGGKKYHGVKEVAEGDGRGGVGGGGGGLDGRVENGDSMEAWDAEMKEMDSLELQLSDEGEQSEFELNEISTIYRQPQPPQQPLPQPHHLQQHYPTPDGGGKRSPAREETKTNGSGSGGDRVAGSPVRLSNVVEGASRQSPPPIVQPAVQPVDEMQQRAQATATSGKKKKKKRREEGSEQSEA